MPPQPRSVAPSIVERAIRNERGEVVDIVDVPNPDV
jgi:hypothetical protein